MSRTFRWRILRATAGAALLISSNSIEATPSSTLRPAPWTAADLTRPDQDAILAGPAAAQPKAANLATVQPDPPPLWVYRKGQWKLVVGNGGGDANPILNLELVKQVDEPAACLLMGMGLILIAVGPRKRRKRALARRRASRLPQRA